MANTPERAHRLRGKFGVGTGIAVLHNQRPLTEPPRGLQGNTCGPNAHHDQATPRKNAPVGRKGGW